MISVPVLGTLWAASFLVAVIYVVSADSSSAHFDRTSKRFIGLVTITGFIFTLNAVWL